MNQKSIDKWITKYDILLYYNSNIKGPYKVYWQNNMLIFYIQLLWIWK